jgi:membrane protease YdiL (CAAX protease family)
MNMRPIFRNRAGELRTGWRIALLLALMAGAVIAINVGWKAGGLPGRSTSGPWAYLAFSVLISGSLLGIVLWLLRYFENQGSTAIGLPFKPGAWKPVALGTLLGAIPIGLIVWLAVTFGYGTVTFSGASIGALFGGLLPMALTLFVLAAWEEVFLRGYLFRQLSLGINPTAAVVVSGMLFGLLHAGNPGANWQGLLYTALGGMLMGLVLLRSGSLWLLIGYHFGWNVTSAGVFGLELSGMQGEASVFVSALGGPEWLSGGAYGFEASLPAVGSELLLLSAVLLYLRRSRRSEHEERGLLRC